MSILEDYGLTNPNGTRSLILKAISNKTPNIVANFKSISIGLWGNPNIVWENLSTVWRSERQRLANYWKSTDIVQNLETLCDCGLIDGDEKEGYTLTVEGRQVIEAMNCVEIHQGEKP